MNKSMIETVAGGIVILIAVIFLAFSYQKADMGANSDMYHVTANFSSIGGLKTGNDVVLAGVKVGSVERVELDPKTYLAIVHLMINNDIKIPSDTAALISSESLLGGKYLSLEPGGADDMLKENDRIQFTQAPQNLEQLLGQFIFSMKDGKDKKEGNNGGASDTP